MAAMLCKFFSAQLAHALKLLVGADRTHRRWHMAGFSSPLLAKFPDCMQMQSGFLLSLRQQPAKSAAPAWRTPKLVKISGIHF
ncbi:hypothetical protein [Mesorhizobium sp. 128a]